MGTAARMGWLATTFTSLPGTTMTLRTVLPSRSALTASSAAACISSLLASAATVAWPRTLPMTCTAISTVSATARLASNSGHGSS